MRTLYIDASMGLAGDMLTASLIELFPDRDVIFSVLEILENDKIKLDLTNVEKYGIVGSHYNVKVLGCEEDKHTHGREHAHVSCNEGEKCHGHQRPPHGHPHPHHHGHHHEHQHHEHEHQHHGHEHEHKHEHAHSHSHMTLGAVHEIIESFAVSAKIKSDVKAIYEKLAKAEGKVHGKPVTKVHFHEVGMLDAIVDITSACILIDLLEVDEVIVSPICTGFGFQKCAHGRMPVPAPATAELLCGIPSHAGNLRGELCTPTGVAIVAHFANKFSTMPVMNVEKIGYGMGTRDYGALSCVRTFIGEATVKLDSAEVLEISANIDDMTAEDLSFAMEILLEAGALDVWCESIGMKKSRMGTKLSVLACVADKEIMAELILKHTSSIGVRIKTCERLIMDRKIETVETIYGEVKAKVSTGFGIEKMKFEHDELAEIAKRENISLATLKKAINEATK